MLNQLIHRPISVSMILIATVAVGILSFAYIPISLMPEVDIPRITVQMANPGASATEIEQKMVTPMRYQLAQVAGLKEIETQSRMDAGTITLTFEPGSDMDLLFIDVNEKIDRAMNTMPKDMLRPKVIKASAMDIPAFYIDITKRGADNDDMAQLSRLVRNVIVKRIEQLPQTAMVDYSGTVGTQIDIVPDMSKMQSLGITSHDIEAAINDNNIVLEALSIVSGIYRYSIHFDSQIITKNDIENIYIRHEGRLLQLKDICSITEKSGVRNGIVRNNGNNAVTIAVIKQNDAQMADLQEGINTLIDSFQTDYPDVKFNITRDQTELLSYSITNLEWNLIIGAVLACLILFIFNGGWRVPLLIIISIPLSLIITLLCFYILGISLNIISLSGLILGIGMIIDNSIIVIDNIRQRHDVITGTREVFMPMLSSVLTTCSVFIPLIFLSGTAGALFYDQAMGVTIALFASLLVATVVVPVYYFTLFRNKLHEKHSERKPERALIHIYEPAMRWTLRHGKLSIGGFVACIAAILLIFPHMEKERMPYIEHNDAIMTIDWNAGISTEENDRRTQELLSMAKQNISITAMSGTQEFILSHTKDITNNEAVVYIKANDKNELDSVERTFTSYVQKNYPKAKIEFNISGNIYDLIFQTDKPDLEIRLQKTEGGRPSVAESRIFSDSIRRMFPEVDIQPVATEEIYRYIANPEQMALYHISYRHLYTRLRELAGNGKVYEITNGEQSIPVIISQNKTNANDIMQKTIRNDEGVDIPLEFIVEATMDESFKRLSAGNEGEYYPVIIEKASDKTIKKIVEYAGHLHQGTLKSIKPSFHGNYYESRQMIKELALILTVAILLLYFILASQFESLLQPIIILIEIVIDVCIVLIILWAMGESVNIMSMIGLVVMSGIIINDSILKVDTINHIYRSNGNISLLQSIIIAGHRRLKPIIMTSLTTILALLPFLTKDNMGAALQFPLSVTIVVGMIAGTMVSLFFVPLIYFIIYRWKETRGKTKKRSSIC
ncbi:MULTISPECIES: efflux RND transporter permease subunit [Bacteroidales]|uniref:efflux RND transporter permease subunit n=1 Tax=Bacteroides pyogenes TaxID=310300 RepID=UPI002F9594F8